MRTWRTWRTSRTGIVAWRGVLLAALASVPFVLAACGGGDDPIDDLAAAVESAADDVDAEAIDEGIEDFAQDAADALGAGGGGTLVFDGEEIPIDSVLCVVDGELLDVGTVSDSDYRVFVSRNNEQNPIDVQILDPDFVQWFPEGEDPEVTRGGGTFSIDTTTFFNNEDDTLVDASFTIECP